MAYAPYQPYGYQQPYQPYQVDQQPQQAAQPSGWVCRPVTSKEEALGVLVDCFGMGTVMPDLAHGVVYLKRFNTNTGASDLYEFVLAPQPSQPAELAPADYAPMLESISERPDFYLDMAKAFIEDEDAVDEKVAEYYAHIVK